MKLQDYGVWTKLEFSRRKICVWIAGVHTFEENISRKWVFDECEKQRACWEDTVWLDQFENGNKRWEVNNYVMVEVLLREFGDRNSVCWKEYI
jgi:hypothetical protein